MPENLQVVLKTPDFPTNDVDIGNGMIQYDDKLSFTMNLPGLNISKVLTLAIQLQISILKLKKFLTLLEA